MELTIALFFIDRFSTTHFCQLLFESSLDDYLVIDLGFIRLKYSNKFR